jgi:hypothetical protein
LAIAGLVVGFVALFRRRARRRRELETT